VPPLRHPSPHHGWSWIYKSPSGAQEPWTLWHGREEETATVEASWSFAGEEDVASIGYTVVGAGEREEETAAVRAAQSFAGEEDIASIGYTVVVARHGTALTRHYASSLTSSSPTVS
jgi:hypothetical protein